MSGVSSAKRSAYDVKDHSETIQQGQADRAAEPLRPNGKAGAMLAFAVGRAEGGSTARSNGKANASAKSKSVRRIELVPFDKIYINRERPRHFIEGLIPANDLALIYGPPKEGKTFVVTDWCLRAGLGLAFPDGRIINHGPVVYNIFEGQHEFAGRIEAWRKKVLPNAKRLVDPPGFYMQQLRLDLINDHKSLIDEIGKHGVDPSCVVLDTLNRSMSGDENSTKDMTAYVSAGDAIREAFGCAVPILHHCGVAGTRPRGNTSLTGAVAIQMFCSKIVKSAFEVFFRVEVELVKDGPAGEALIYQVSGVDLGLNSYGEKLNYGVIDLLEGEEAAAAMSGLKGSNSKGEKGPTDRALDYLRALIAEQGEIAPVGVDAESVVAVSTWKQRCVTYGLSKSDRSDVQKKAFSRALDILLLNELIGVHGEEPMRGKPDERIVWIREPAT